MKDQTIGSTQGPYFKCETFSRPKDQVTLVGPCAHRLLVLTSNPEVWHVCVESTREKHPSSMSTNIEIGQRRRRVVNYVMTKSLIYYKNTRTCQVCVGVVYPSNEGSHSSMNYRPRDNLCMGYENNVVPPIYTPRWKIWNFMIIWSPYVKFLI